MTTPLKRKVSVSLDADLVDEFEEAGPLSTQINEALRSVQQHRRHQRHLGELLRALDEEDGPLDSPDDEAAIQRYIDILS